MCGMEMKMTTKQPEKGRPFRARGALGTGFMAVSLVLAGVAVTQQSDAGTPTVGQGVTAGQYVVLAYNDLGMHCMNEEFADLCILPPANTLKATVIRRGSSPEIITGDVSVTYSIPGNTTSVTKTNFWDFDQALFGVNLPADVGLFGFGMSGNMVRTATKEWAALGIPVTPFTDAGVFDPYQLAQVNVYKNGSLVASTQPVVPVSTEINCDRCHGLTRTPTNINILRWHDKYNGTRLEANRPVLCASCHADSALGAPGKPGVSNLSLAVHRRHKDKFNHSTPEDTCYACHPGKNTQCYRDVHKAGGLTCFSCHGDMQAMSNPNRTPWKDEPRCGNCHNEPGHEYEQPGVLFKDSVGHNGVKCIVCHGSPHAITPTLNPRDNVQAIGLQGHAGVIDKCSVCHTSTPEHPFNHTRGDD